MPTKEIQLKGQVRAAEIVQCGQDPIYFMKRYVYISHPKRGIIKFDTFPFQDECVKAFQEHRYNIILKSRQLGLSTITAAYCLWVALFQKEKNILVIATRLDVAKNFLRKVKQMFDGLPPWLVMPTVKEESVRYLTFTNGSRITAIPTGQDAGRSEAVSLLICDEAAHIEKFDYHWMGLNNTTTHGGSTILLSTPKGVGNKFHELWMGCDLEQHTNSFHGIKLPWDVHPEHDEAWFENECKNLDKRGIAQELLCVGQETKIVTQNGFTKASDIEVGDLVLTHRGRLRCVTKIQKRLLNPLENLYKVSVPLNRGDPLFVTGNHPVYNTHFHLPKGKNQWNFLVENKLEPEFTSIDDLEKFCNKTNKRKFGVLSPQFQKTEFSGLLSKIDLAKLVESQCTDESHCSYKFQRRPTRSTRFIPVNQDLGRFIGLAVAEGCLVTNKKVKHLILGFHSNEKETLVKFVTNFFDRYGLSYSINERNYSKCITVDTCNKYATALYELFVHNNTGATTKILRFDQFLRTNPLFVQGYLIGHFDGAGDHETSVTQNNSGNKLKVVSKSEKLLYQVRTLISLFGHYPRLGQCNSAAASYLEFDGLKYTNIKNIEQLLNTPRKKLEQPTSRVKSLNSLFLGNFQCVLVPHAAVDYVVDIEVEEDHSFVAGSLVLHNCSFAASGDTYIAAPELHWLEEQIVPPIAKFEFDPNVWIWRFPIPGHKYIVSADVARGDGDDFSTFHILDADEREIVAEYQGKRPPDRLAELLVEIGARYNNAMICNEKNSFGLATSYKLRDLKYPTLYYEKLAKGGPYQVYTENDTEGETPGFTTSSKNRTQILASLESAVRNKTLKIYSSRFAEEAKTLIWTGQRAHAQKGYNDDLSMSLAILCWIFDLGTGAGIVDNAAMNQAMVRAWSKSSTTYTSVGYAQMASNQNNPNGNNPAITGFTRSSMSNNYKTPGVMTPEGFITVPPDKVPPGVNKEQLENALNIYNIYNWLTK